MCPDLGTIPYSNFHCLIRCRGTATCVQIGRHYPCKHVRRSGSSQQLSTNFSPSHREQASWENCVNAAQSVPGQQQSSSWYPVCLPRQPLNWRCSCIYGESENVERQLPLVFVDLSKAFDRVKHQALIDLLSGIGFCDTVLKWFANYLSDRQQLVCVGNRFSSQSACSRGVPQGCVLGSLLFTLCVRDLPSCVDVKVLMFADDILLFFSGLSIPEITCRLTNAVTSLDSWLTTRGLQMNIGKTQAMFVLPRCLNIPPDTVVMCNSRPLQLATPYKYLGVFLDNRISWEAQILHITGKVSQKIGASLRAGQQLTLPAKRLFYMAIIGADIEYAIHKYGSNAFYSSLSTSLKEKLICLSKRGVRAIFRAPPWTPSLPLYQQVQICRIPQRMDYKLLVFTYRCTHSLTSTLLTNEFSVHGQSNARTRFITPDQSFISFLDQRLSPLSYNISSLYLLTFVELSAVFSAASRCWFLYM